MNLKRICPICSSEVAEVLCRVQLSGVVAEDLPGDFSVVVCSSCGFCFDDMDATQDDFDRYYHYCMKYQALGTKGSGGALIQDIERYESVFRCCQPYLRQDSSILDIGSGKGGFLQYLQQKGYGKVTAVEPSTQSPSLNGIKFYNSISQIKGLNKNYDFIFCTHVLEHVFDLKSFILDMISVASKDAFFYIEVPNADTYINGLQAPFYYFDREHINHFTEKSMENIFLINSHKKCVVRNENNLSFIFKKAEDSLPANLKVDRAENIRRYVAKSCQNDKISFEVDGTKPVILWGLGAYLRRLVLKDSFPQKIAAVIDRDRGGKDLFWNGIPIVTAEILSTPKFSDATVIITSVLYADEIKKQISALNFRGTVLTAF